MEPKAAFQVVSDMVKNKKNAINLHFLKSSENQGMSMPLFNCKLTVDGTLYTGIGPSKDIAKNAAAESALAGLINKRHTKMADLTEVSLSAPEQEEVELSWNALSSFAVYKLINDWKSEGIELPEGFANGSFVKNAPKPPPVTPEAPEENGVEVKEEEEDEGGEEKGYHGLGFGRWGGGGPVGGMGQGWGNFRSSPMSIKKTPHKKSKWPSKAAKTPSLTHSPQGAPKIKAPAQILHEMMVITLCYYFVSPLLNYTNFLVFLYSINFVSIRRPHQDCSHCERN